MTAKSIKISKLRKGALLRWTEVGYGKRIVHTGKFKEYNSKRILVNLLLPGSPLDGWYDYYVTPYVYYGKLRVARG